jgi:hypothetical protein
LAESAIAIRRQTTGLPVNRVQSLQVLFDEVVDAVRRQGYVKSEGARESCMYHGENGARCPVGLLIPAADYRPEFEGLTVGDLHGKGLFFTELPPAELALLTMFQGIHDDDFPEDWEAAFEALALQLGLDYRRQK